MKNSIKTGFSFGLTSGIITTIGLMVGLYSTTHSKTVVIGGILTIAIADALSDALGIHISEEAKGKSSTREIWEATLATFLSKFFFTLTFAAPVLLFELQLAMLVSIIWALLILAILSLTIAKAHKKNPLPIILEHLGITVVVLIATHYLGQMISGYFG